MARNFNRALIDISRRAENVDPNKLAETFVETGPEFGLLQSKDHQIIYGRRGTGKTHALNYLAEEVSKLDSVPLFIDLRTIGSSGGIYADPNIPIAERGTRLLLDVLEAIQSQLMDYALELSYESGATQLLANLDMLAEQIGTSVRVVGVTVREQVDAESTASDRKSSLGVTVSAKPAITAGSTRREQGAASHSTRVTEAGVVQHRVHFGAVAKYLEEIASAISPGYVWILLDEWSSIPQDLQPILADLIKRAILPVRGYVVKIAAIEQRSRFRESDEGGSIGFEIGADIVADLDLDDILVFKNDADKATNFFKELLFKHVVAYFAEHGLTEETPRSSDEFVQSSFTQDKAFQELVRAAEGVPRDAINIANMSALNAGDSAIGIQNIRKAARDYYLRDKESAVAANVRAESLLHWIIDSVIGGRQARGFLLKQGSDSRNELIRDLYDSRVIHLIKKGVAAKDQPGVRYNVFSIDYGAYVELIVTGKGPNGLFNAESDDGEIWVVVPQDDYRSIRRAILNLDEFERAHPS